MTSAAVVAAWMLERLRRDGVLHQDDAAAEIEHRFGADFVGENERGNAAISKAVLAEFLKVTGHDVVWSRSERLWRPREPGDEPTRNQP